MAHSFVLVLEIEPRTPDLLNPQPTTEYHTSSRNAGAFGFKQDGSHLTGKFRAPIEVQSSKYSELKVPESPALTWVSPGHQH